MITRLLTHDVVGVRPSNPAPAGKPELLLRPSADVPPSGQTAMKEPKSASAEAHQRPRFGLSGRSQAETCWSKKKRTTRRAGEETTALNRSPWALRKPRHRHHRHHRRRLLGQQDRKVGHSLSSSASGLRRRPTQPGKHPFVWSVSTLLDSGLEKAGGSPSSTPSAVLTSALLSPAFLSFSAAWDR